MKPALILAALLLSGCAHKVVTRSCITPEQLQQLKDAEPPKVGDSLTGRADEDVRTLGGSAIRLRAWGGALIDTLEICAG